MKPTSTIPHDLEMFAQRLAVLPIDVHLTNDRILIELCSVFLTNALHFWNAHRKNVPIIEALSTILSHDYHDVMKPGFREIRHLININQAIQEEIKKIHDQLAIDQSLNQIQCDALAKLNAEAVEIDRRLNQAVDSTILTLENALVDLRKSSIRVWDKASFDPSVIPKDI